jgi:hypothetical protein
MSTSNINRLIQKKCNGPKFNATFHYSASSTDDAYVMNIFYSMPENISVVVNNGELLE